MNITKVRIDLLAVKGLKIIQGTTGISRRNAGETATTSYLSSSNDLRQLAT